MLLKTHLVISIFVIIVFISSVESKVFFSIAVLLATIIPDIDTSYSYLGNFKGFRFLQFFTKHRGIFHSLTTALILSVVLAFYLPVFAAGFFLAYSLHIFSDSFTIEGVQPFWPLSHKSSWKIRTGGLSETSIFACFALIDIILIIFLAT